MFNPKSLDTLHRGVGEKHPSWKGGVQKMKRDGPYKYCGVNKRKPMAKYVREDIHGLEVPEGYVMYHSDGNVNNNDITNLQCISRGELLRKNNFNS